MLTLHCGREAKCSSSGGGRLLVAVVSLESYIILGSIPNGAGTMVLWLSFLFDYGYPAVLDGAT